MSLPAKPTRPPSAPALSVEEQLRQAEQRFHHLVDAITDRAVFMLVPSGHVLTWNVGAQRIKGYGPDEIIGKHFSVFYTPEEPGGRRAGSDTEDGPDRRPFRRPELAGQKGWLALFRQRHRHRSSR